MATRGDRFRVGTLGIGDDRLAAMRAAIEEWHLLAASAVLTALGADVDKRRKTPIRLLAGWELFPGCAGIRGTLPTGLNPGGIFYRQLLDVLHNMSPLAAARRFSTPAPFDLRDGHERRWATRNPSRRRRLLAAGSGNGTGRVPWPTAADAYLFKQLLVLRGGKMPGGAV